MQDKRALEQLQQFHTQFKNLVDPKDISVLVRLPNKGTGLNLIPTLKIMASTIHLQTQQK